MQNNISAFVKMSVPTHCPLVVLLFLILSVAIHARPANPESLVISHDPAAIAAASVDFGHMVNIRPAAVLQPSSPADIVELVRSSYTSATPFTIGARGNGHSTHGQSLVENGVVVNMSAMAATEGRIIIDPENLFVDAGGEQLWDTVLKATLKLGLAPKSWADYLYLSVGGALSNAGISGQVFKYGPQISNVLEMDVITGKGELITCSKKQNSDLFDAVLGGLGQFGIITRARIALEKAPRYVRWIHLSYHNFTTYTEDQEHLITIDKNGFDYLEGMVNNNNGSLVYNIEVAKYYNDPSELYPILDNLLHGLRYIAGGLRFKDVSYFDFLDRVHQTELKLRAAGLWVVPHPWLDILVPSSRVVEIDAGIFRGVAKDDLTMGPVIIYPMNRNKWDENTSAVIPGEEVFYLFEQLKTAKNNWQKAEEQNAKVLEFMKSKGIKYKLYLPNYHNTSDWEQHFGPKWSTFVALKEKYDPLKILSPGQKIFN